MTRKLFYIFVLIINCSCEDSAYVKGEPVIKNNLVLECTDSTKSSITLSGRNEKLQYNIPAFFDTAFKYRRNVYSNNSNPFTYLDTVNIFTNRQYTILDYNRDFNKIEVTDSIFSLFISFSYNSPNLNLDSIKNIKEIGMNQTWLAIRNSPDSSFLYKKHYNNLEYLISYVHLERKQGSEQVLTSATSIKDSIMTSISCNCIASNCNQAFELMEKVLNSITYCRNK